MDEKLQQMLEKAPADDSLAGLLKRPEYAKRFEAVLGARAPQFASSLLSLGASMKDVEPKSILASAMIAAALDLPIDKNLGHAWIIPYKGRAQFQIGSKGWVQLAMRSGQYKRMNSMAINREVFLGWDDVGEPTLDWSLYDPNKPIWGYFFGFQLTNGFSKMAVWSKERVLQHAQRFSQAYRNDAAIWREHFDGMAEKTVVSNILRKWGPLSIQMQVAMKADSAVFTDVDSEASYVELDDVPDKPEEHPAKQKQVTETAAAKTEKPVVKETKAAAKEKSAKPIDVVSNVVPMPPPVVPPPADEDAKAEADLGFAPSRPATPEPEPAPPAIVEIDNSAKDSLTLAEMTPAQLAAKEMFEAAGYTFEEVRDWAFETHMVGKAFATWSDMPEGKAEFFVKTPKGALAGISTWKKKKQGK